MSAYDPIARALPSVVHRSLATQLQFARAMGVECGEGVVFRAGEWSPGGEYTGFLSVKNVLSEETIKLRYRLP